MKELHSVVCVYLQPLPTDTLHTNAQKQKTSTMLFPRSTTDNAGITYSTAIHSAQQNTRWQSIPRVKKIWFVNVKVPIQNCIIVPPAATIFPALLFTSGYRLLIRELKASICGLKLQKEKGTEVKQLDFEWMNESWWTSQILHASDVVNGVLWAQINSGLRLLQEDKKRCLCFSS